MRSEERTGLIPIVLVWMYIIFFFCTGLQLYADCYKTISFIDTFLLVCSILFYFTDRSYWTYTAKRSLLTVIVLNILTELSFRYDMPYYYLIYEIVIVLYLLSLGIDAYFKKRK